ncbi:MAG: hypothetical protein KF836_00735 [Fimbriimonadaceae bacterium]|nr:hypothetical protein [Fimbriimonadaceae bacterium]
MKVQPLTRDVIPACHKLWNETIAAKYRVELATLEAKTFGHPNYLPDHSLTVWDGDSLAGFLAAKADPVGSLYLEPNLRRIHINSMAFRDAQIAHLMLQILESLSSNLIVFGQDNGHFFPGVPEEWTELHSIFQDRGYIADEHWANDLEHDVREFNPPSGSLEPLSATKVEFRRCTQADVPQLDEFFAREFPGRWHYDSVTYKILQQKEPNDIFALWVDGIVEGFAYTQSSQTTKIPVAGCVWTPDLGENWGGLGPIGVSKRVRGMKLGGAVLAGALQSLKESGVYRCIIDWTSLVDFYGKYGFYVNRRYKSYRSREN